MQAVLLNELYERLTASVIPGTGTARINALQRLKPELYALRSAYRAGTVDISYESDDRAAAYLLAYFPHYVYMTYTVLLACVLELPKLRMLNVAFFGGGPLPELIGLLEALRAKNRLPNAIDVDAYDVCEDWSSAVRITKKLARQFTPEVDVSVNCVPVDFRQRIDKATRNALGDRNMLILQNCCNEMVASPFYHANIDALTDALPSGALIVVADQSNYSDSVAAIRQIEDALRVNPRYTIVHTFSVDDPEYRTPFRAPVDVRDHFFDGTAGKDALTGTWRPGEYERRTLKFSFTLARKT